jgi:hypothetical protein
MSITFDRIIVVMLENTTCDEVLLNPYMNSLRQKGVFMAKSYGVTHSSQPNYIASVAGDLMGFNNDSPSYAQWVYSPTDPVPVTCLSDLLEEKGLTWKNYVEDLPSTYLDQCVADLPNWPNCNFPSEPMPFARKHAPFLSFRQCIADPNLKSKIVDSNQFYVDLAAGALPSFSWYTPNLYNDGHTLMPNQQPAPNRQTNIANIAAFLQDFLGPDPVTKFPPSTLIVITFDEAYPYHDPYKVYTLLIGDHLQSWAGQSRGEPVNHYSLLKSVQKNFGLNSLERNDAVALPYWFLG